MPGYLFLDNFCLKFVLVYIVAARRRKNFLKGGTIMLDKEKIEAARHADLVSFLRSAGVELKREPGRSKTGLPQYRVVGKGGLIVWGSLWYHFSTSEGGNAIDFLMKYMGMTFTEAVEALTGPGAVRIKNMVSNEKPVKRRKFSLPPRARDDYRVVKYLEERRGITRELVEQVIREGLLYQDVRGNCVFVCRDAAGVARAAYLRGTGDNRYVGLVAGSDRQFGWRREVCPDGCSVVIAESPIDLMSLAMLQPKLMKSCNWLSLNGLHLPAADKYLDDNRHIRTVLIVFDNDVAGQETALKYVEILDSRGYEVVNMRPCREGADLNDMLLSCKDL